MLSEVFLKDSSLTLEINKKHEIIRIKINSSNLISNDKKGIPIKKIPFAGVGKPKK